MSDKYDRKRAWVKFKPGVVPVDSRAPPRRPHHTARKPRRITMVDHGYDKRPRPEVANNRPVARPEKRPEVATATKRPVPHHDARPRSTKRPQNEPASKEPRINKYGEEIYEGESTLESVRRFLTKQGKRISKFIIKSTTKW